MEYFLSNEEVLFFVYGILFPNSAVDLTYENEDEVEENPLDIAIDKGVALPTGKAGTT